MKVEKLTAVPADFDAKTLSKVTVTVVVEGQNDPATKKIDRDNEHQSLDLENGVPNTKNGNENGASSEDPNGATAERAHGEEDVSIPEAQVVTGVNDENPAPEGTRNLIVVVPENDYDVAEGMFWCLFTGFIGGHWFYLNQPGKGILYALTLGLLGLGVVTDFFRMPMLVVRARAQVSSKRLNQPYLYEPNFQESYWMFFLTGIFGGHYFYLKRPGMGFLYLFTLGFLGIGWLHDLIFQKVLFERAEVYINKTFIEKHGLEAFEDAKAVNKAHRDRVFSALKAKANDLRMSQGVQTRQPSNAH